MALEDLDALFDPLDIKESRTYTRSASVTFADQPFKPARYIGRSDKSDQRQLETACGDKLVTNYISNSAPKTIPTLTVRIRFNLPGYTDQQPVV